MGEDNIVVPDWPAPPSVQACITTRVGGCSRGSYQANNVALHVGDTALNVQTNRQSLCSQIGLSNVQWLHQIHATDVVEARANGQASTADGCFSRQPDLACAVMTADCLPVFVCNRQGTQVAVLHAGWRGMAAGVLAAGIKTFADRVADLLVYFGPAISQMRFEVGAEVRQAFFSTARSAEHTRAIESAFIASENKPQHFFCNLYALAKAELNALGVVAIYGGNYCTFDDEKRFYSFRRDGVTGRMASLIWLRHSQ